MNVVIEELKQRIIAIAAKVRRYQERVVSYRQNRLFQNNQRQFFRELHQEEERCDDDQPVAEESKQLLGNMWSQSADHKDAKCLQDLQNEVNVKKQEKIDITTRSLKKILARMPNLMSAGSDLAQGFLLKNFSSLHERVRLQVKGRLDSAFVSGSLTRERTSLLHKDKSKANAASNYRPITC